MLDTIVRVEKAASNIILKSIMKFTLWITLSLHSMASNHLGMRIKFSSVINAILS